MVENSSLISFGRRIAMALAAIAAVCAAAAQPASARGPESVSAVAEPLMDAVVNISTSQTVKSAQGVPLPRVPKGSPFEEFFEDFFKKKGGGSPNDRKVSSLGSGFVIDGAAGLIVTNNHVIEGADEIIINFHDGSKLKVEKVVGIDKKTDLALLKVTSKKPLPAVKFGSSEAIKVGDWVLAIGNPFGLGGSVTLGIISAKQRNINSGPYDEYLQTDAAINKGNSGGPLFNMAGQVIGVNTAIISPSGGSIGIGFAVPSDTATAVVEQLRQFGEIRRGWLGVQMQTVTEEAAEALGIKENTGALVAKVTPGGPAAAAGIISGDVILKFDGKDVSTLRGLPRLVSQTAVGKTVDVEILRKNERKVVKVAVGRLPEDETEGKEKPKAPGAGKADPSAAILGMKLQPMADDVRRKYDFPATAKGLVVVEVEPDTPAAKKSVKPGDLIVEAGQEAMLVAEDLTKAIEAAKKATKKAILLRIEDNKGEVRLVALPIASP
jgi:serine protease Do